MFSCFCGGLSFLALFCHVKCYEMKCSLEDSDLTEGHGGTKSRKSLEFVSEDGGAAGTVDSASRFGGEKVVETAKEIMRRKLLEKQEKQKKKKAETFEELDQLQSWHKELSAAGFSCEILNSDIKALSTRRVQPNDSVS